MGCETYVSSNLINISIKLMRWKSQNDRNNRAEIDFSTLKITSPAQRGVTVRGKAAEKMSVLTIVTAV